MVKDNKYDSVIINTNLSIPYFVNLPPNGTRPGSVAYRQADNQVYVWNSTAWVPIGGAGSGFTLNTTAPILGGAVVPPSGTVTLSHATSGVASGSYGVASTGTIPTVAVNTFGHVTSASQATLPTVAIQGDGSNITGSGNAFGLPGTITLNLSSINPNPGTYGSASQIPSFTVDAFGRIDSITSVTSVPTGAITVNTTGPLTVTGSPVSLGGSITLNNTALLNTDAFNNWKAGTGSLVTGTDNVIIGNVAKNTNGKSVSIGSLANAPTNSVAVGYNVSPSASATANFNVLIGYQCAPALTDGQNNVLIGDGAGPTLTTAASCVCVGTFAGLASPATSLSSVAIGQNTRMANGSVSVGFGAESRQDGGVAVGYLAISNSTECQVLGGQLLNSSPNTTLIGVGTAGQLTHVVKSTGYFKPHLSSSAKGGRKSGTQNVPASTTALVAIIDTFYDSGEPLPYVNTALNRVYLGNTTDPLQTFQINVSLIGVAFANPYSYYITLDYTDPAGSTSTIAASSYGSGAEDSNVTANMSTTVQLPAGPLANRAYVQVNFQNLSVSTGIDVTFLALSVTRLT